MKEFSFNHNLMIIQATDLEKALKEFHKATGNKHRGMKDIDVSVTPIHMGKAVKPKLQRIPWLPPDYKGV